ncbi:MAG TPA: AGE family epimerase/isomerase [Povalibacter sp.]|mgnify:CR=1 FL=1|uniref:AGE family epimerase/isomerase n=1 Tax=Povalibacter sp. TaxID=1962978 RepID=UPI002CF217B1|nr:AGE family epimerase/isomerase [Povalibacter sp.]HMN44058.1 AGE family epimerase/isomerase [Povalibacter sp.]
MSSALHEAAELCESLKRWLLEDAYPMWWLHGADRERGGFHESLQLDGNATGAPRRARLHPRQIHAYSQADDLGWSGPHEEAVKHGLDFFLAHYRRPDRFYRTLVTADGRALDDRAVLYDQAFALLGLAAAYDTLDDDALRDSARDLHEQLRAQLQNPAGGFEEANPRVLPLGSNSHMHLFESCLAWMDLDHDARWQATANEIVELALLHFIDPVTGLLREFFDGEWRPIAGDEGRIVEPGHQFEWGWLLLRWVERTGEIRAREPALRMIQFGESLGVDAQRGVAITSLLSDGSVRDPLARLWPQTERIKAACIAAETTRQPEYWAMVAAAARGLLKYLDTPRRGLWRDKLNVDGTFVEEPAPASSFYHIVCAIAELEHTLKRVL